jgi:short-subunit dehydrogenase
LLQTSDYSVLLLLSSFDYKYKTLDVAANAALINFFETLRTELGNQVGITVVTPGWVESEMSRGKFLKEHGQVEVDQEMRDVSEEHDHAPVECLLMNQPPATRDRSSLIIRC